MSRDAAADAPADVQGDLGSDAATCGVLVSPVILFGSLNPGESQLFPAIAFDGTNYLAVWQQGLSPGTNWKLYGSRVSRDGVVLDASPFLVSDTYSTVPAVAFNGTDFDVIWSDERKVSSEQIYGTRVTTSGTVRDPAGILIEAPPASGPPSIACGTNGCLAAWRFRDSPALKVPVGLYGTRLDGSLTTLDSPRLPFALRPDCNPNPDAGHPCRVDPTNPNLVSAGSDYFLTWTSGKDVEGMSVSVAGVSGAPIVIGGVSPFRTGLAFGGGEFFVSWVSGFGGSTTGFEGSRVAGTSVLDSPALPLATVTIYGSPVTVFDGLHFVTVWTGGTGHLLVGTRVTTTGALLDSPGFTIDPGAASYGIDPAIASSGQGSSLAADVACTTTDADAALDCRIRAYILHNCP
jgi:hypothetical protein